MYGVYSNDSYAKSTANAALWWSMRRFVVFFLTGVKAVIKIQALGHTMVFDDLTRENDIDRDSEKWSVEFGEIFFSKLLFAKEKDSFEVLAISDGQVIAKMYLHPDHGWPKIVTPFGRYAFGHCFYCWLYLFVDDMGLCCFAGIRFNRFARGCGTLLVHTR